MRSAPLPLYPYTGGKLLKSTIMRVTFLATVLVLSLLVCAMTVESLGVVFWCSLAALACTCLYISKHEKELDAELRGMGK